MKITDVSTALLRVPLKQRSITDSQSKVDSVEFLQVTLSTDDGVTGYGMNWSYTTGLRAAQVAVDDNYAPLLEGADPLMRKELVRQCYFSNHFVGRVGAAAVGLAAVEFALWDLACKSVNRPLWQYLGPCREKVKAYSTDGGWLTWSTDELIRDATRLIERGFDAVKVKLGRPDPREDLARIAAVRRAIGPSIKLMTDVNCAWSLGTAQFWGARLAEHDVFWLEEPMHPFDVKSHAALARSITVPIAVGETIYTKYAFRDFIEAGAVHIVQADATKLQGIDEWLEVAALASAANLPVIPHTNVQHKLHVQLAAATPGVMMVENCYESIADIWEEPIYVKDGYYELPQEPGVGLKIRDEVVRATRVA
ncbi:MAG TPA: mandelate racemase/muconate lactonizing enzyme family protein [Polyangiaceae bacterium]|jgi:L-alanine-DL-glutamate epimerase-like enolase superfamily enzyme